jgi:DNA repair protein SbcC/Rad50
VRLVRLAIDRLPGIQPGFAIDGLAPGVHLVLGPNASGKSSLVRALRYLVVPPAANDPADLVLAATFEGGDGRWEVTRTGGGQVWRRDGAPGAAPSLPEPTFLHCYWLSMEDLLASHENDRALLDRLRRELSGGFDLAALRQTEPYRLGPLHGRREERAVGDAERELRRVQGEHEKLRRDEERLPRLTVEIEEAERAATSARWAQRARELVWVQRARRSEGVALDGEDSESSLGRRLAEVVEKREARRSLITTGLEDAFPPPETLAARRRDLEELGELARNRQQAARRLDEARIARQQVAFELGADPDLPLPRLAPEVVARAERAAQKAHELAKQALELKAQVSAAASADGAEGGSPFEELERRTRAVGELRRWLRAGASGLRWGGASVALAGAVAVFGAHFLGAPPGVTLIVAAGALAALAVLLASLPAVPRAGARRRFLGTGLPAPEPWSTAAVEWRLETLEAEAAELRSRRSTAPPGEALASRLEQAVKAQELAEQELGGLARELGFDPRATLDFYRFVSLAREWDRAARRLAEEEAEMDRLSREMQPLATGLSLFLEEWGERIEEQETSPPRLREGLAALERRSQVAQEARSREQSAQRSLESLEEELERLEAERVEELRQSPKLLALVAAGDEAGIQAHRRDLEEEAERAEGLRQERADIRNRLDRARRAHDLEEALACHDQARGELAVCRQRALHAAAGHFLLDEVEREHRIEGQPALLRDAGERFARFTRHAYTLELDPVRGLVARDRRQGELRSLGELSTGTRMQLFLALRMAWARSVEGHHEPLPLFLDEALTTSDPQRFAEVARALESLADDEGRQVFYLTAQPTDCHFWEQGTGRTPQVVDLLEARRQGAFAAAEELRLPAQPQAPEPTPGEAPEAYARRLGVPYIDPAFDAGLIHPFHLLRDDLPSLHQLLELWGVDSLGQLEALLERPVGASLVGKEKARLLRHRIAIARCWVEAFRAGRGRPVDRAALERSGAVSEVFLDEVSSLAARVDGDPARLLAELRAGRVARFLRSKMDELEGWLEAEGYLDRRPRLDAAGRRRETLLAWGAAAPDAASSEVIAWLEAGCQQR